MSIEYSKAKSGPDSKRELKRSQDVAKDSLSLCLKDRILVLRLKIFWNGKEV
jgi:hypothetical protein